MTPVVSVSRPQGKLDDATENEAFLQGDIDEKDDIIRHLEAAMKGR